MQPPACSLGAAAAHMLLYAPTLSSCCCCCCIAQLSCCAPCWCGSAAQPLLLTCAAGLLCSRTAGPPSKQGVVLRRVLQLACHSSMSSCRSIALSHRGQVFLRSSQAYIHCTPQHTQHGCERRAANALAGGDAMHASTTVAVEDTGSMLMHAAVDQVIHCEARDSHSNCSTPSSLHAALTCMWNECPQRVKILGLSAQHQQQQREQPPRFKRIALRSQGGCCPNIYLANSQPHAPHVPGAPNCATLPGTMQARCWALHPSTPKAALAVPRMAAGAVLLLPS